MTATDEQLRAIAYLAKDCRPHGARPWGESGIYANLAKVRDRSLGSIIIAAIQAAEDRGAVTPGVIPTAGPHWRAPEAAVTTTAGKIDPALHCAGCGEPKAVCETRLTNQRGMDPDDPRYDDHTYVAVGAARAHKRNPETAADIRDALKAELAPMREPAHAERPTSPSRLRALMPTTTTAAPETEEIPNA